MSSGADSALMTVTRQLTTLVLALVTLFATAINPAVAGDSEVDIEGGGWGHGIGMSQFGAYGQALEGRTAEEIVGHYYTGSSTGQTRIGTRRRPPRAW